MGQSASFTFPLMLDVILHIEVHCDVGSHAGRPAFSYLGLGHLHDGEGGDGLRHPGPPPKHHAAVLRLPARVGGRERATGSQMSAAGGCRDRNQSDLGGGGRFGGQHMVPLLTYLLFAGNKQEKFLHRLT